MHNRRASQDGYDDEVTSPTAAPGELERVRQLINSRNVEAGTDCLTDADSAAAWLAGQGVAHPVTEADLRRLVSLREALRAACVANHDGQEMPAAAAEALTENARRAALCIAIGGPRGWSVHTSADGLAGYLGAILSTVVTAMSGGEWTRLRVCRLEDCQWAFYDSSRARTRAWCSMRGCGNRAKQARWRERTPGQNRSGPGAEG
jgi:predicted RNA-binding Zn ribbon-like protein